MTDTAPMDFEDINSPEFLEMLLSGGTGGRIAFTRLVKAGNDRFLGFIHRQLSSREECQEVLQEVYLAVHKGLPGFAGKSKLTTWIYSLAHHKICDRIAERKRRRGEIAGESGADSSTDGTAPDRWAGISEWDAPADRLAARNAVEGLIGKALESLPEQSLRIYHLRDVEGLSGEEAAEVLGMTPENARVQLHRARRQIVDWVREKMAGAGSQGKSGREGGKS